MTLRKNSRFSREYSPPERLVIIVGNYGSGKTEVAVNLAMSLAAMKKQIKLADLDVVNPYFRSRDAISLLGNAGVEVVVPKGDLRFADLPIVVPQIKGMLSDAGEDHSIFDVGGDDVGARMLSSLYEAFQGVSYSLLQVLNAKRPFSDSLDGCLKMKEKIETASRMKVTGFISNAHLMEQTDSDVIREGYELATQVSRKSGVPLDFITAMDELADNPALGDIEVPIFRLKRNMLPPWLVATKSGQKEHLDA